MPERLTPKAQKLIEAASKISEERYGHGLTLRYRLNAYHRRANQLARQCTYANLITGASRFFSEHESGCIR